MIMTLKVLIEKSRILLTVLCICRYKNMDKNRGKNMDKSLMNADEGAYLLSQPYD